MSNGIRDGLTGLLTKEEFFEHANKVFKTASTEANSEKRRRLTLALLDLDKFGFFNEKYGHAFGDQILQETAALIQENLEDKGIIGRYGGDEFLVFFDDVSFEETFIMLENLRRDIKGKVFSRNIDGEEVKAEITTSIGISSYPNNGRDIHELLRNADEALYRAKKEGRDRIYLAIEEKKVPKTVYYTKRQVERVAGIAKRMNRLEAELFREAVDLIIEKYDERS